MSGFYWFASYPKSGNTWMRMALWALHHGRAIDFRDLRGWIPVIGPSAVFDEELGVESSDLTAAEIEVLRPRLFERLALGTAQPMLRKVHEAWVLTPAGEPLFPPALTLGAVYIVRDPRDVAVALSYHQGVTLDTAIAFMGNWQNEPAKWRHTVQRQLICRWLSWSQHVESWLDAPGIRVLPLRYEDMVADMPTALARVAAFLEWDTTPDAIDAAVKETCFERLRAAEERHGFREKPRHMERFFRRGQAGGWRDVLTREQVTRIVSDHGVVMERLGYP